MLEVTDQIPDTANDEIGRLLAAALAVGHHNSEWRDLLAQAVLAMEKQGYVTIRGTYKSYNMSRIGQSCQYDVPMDRRGGLLPFRGKRVRIVCSDNYGYNGKIFMAGPVG